MQKLNLFYVIESFNRKELKEFENFLNSSFFNNKRYLINFYLEVKRFCTGNRKAEISKEDVFKKLYPSRDYKDSTFRKLSSELLRLAEKYLAYKNFSENHDNNRLSLIKELEARNLNKLLLTKIKSFLNIKRERKNPEDFYHDYNLRKILYAYYNETDSYSDETDIKLLIDLISKFFLCETLTNYTGMLHAKYYYDRNADSMPFMKDTVMILKNHYEGNDVLLNVYFSLFEMISDYDNEKLYHETDKQLDKNFRFISKKALFELYNEMQNYCWVKIYKGIIKFEDEVFNLYKKMIDRDVFCSKYFPHVFFDNIVIAGANAGNPEWSLKFLNEYKDRLNPAIKETVIAYNLSTIYYSQKKFGKAIEILSKLEFIDYSYKLRIKSDMIKINYELGNFDSVMTSADSMKHFIAKDKRTSKDYNLAFKNFTDVLINIIKLKEKKDIRNLKYLKKNILQSDTMFNKPWLLDKITESLTVR